MGSARRPDRVRLDTRRRDEPVGSPYRGPLPRGASLIITVEIPPAHAPGPGLAAGALASVAGLLAISPLPPVASGVGAAALGTLWLGRLRALLRLDRRATAREVVLEVDDAGVAVRDPCGEPHALAASSIAQLFVVERMPPGGCFLPWYGLFARRRGERDALLLETPEWRVARYVERQIEARLDLADEPVRGELRRADE